MTNKNIKQLYFLLSVFIFLNSLYIYLFTFFFLFSFLVFYKSLTTYYLLLSFFHFICFQKGSEMLCNRCTFSDRLWFELAIVRNAHIPALMSGLQIYINHKNLPDDSFDWYVLFYDYLRVTEIKRKFNKINWIKQRNELVFWRNILNLNYYNFRGSKEKYPIPISLLVCWPYDILIKIQDMGMILFI